MRCPNCWSVHVEDHIEFGMAGYKCLRCNWIWFDNGSVSYQIG